LGILNNNHLQKTIAIGRLLIPLIINREEEVKYRNAQKEVIRQISEFQNQFKEYEAEEMLIKLLYMFG